MKGFEDAFTDLQAEFVSLCMEYTNGNVDKIYIYIYQDTSQKMFNAIFVKGNDVIPAGNFADDEASDEFLSIGTKDINKLVEFIQKKRLCIPVSHHTDKFTGAGSLDALCKFKHRRNSDSSADQESFLSRLHGKSVSKRSQYPDLIARF